MIPVEAEPREAWEAALELEFALDAGRSLLVTRRHTGPLRVQKPLYPEGPGTCHAIVVHPPGGIADGDRLQLDFTVRAGAQALVTTPGAAKWYRATHAGARQDVRLAVEPGGMLEWLPQETIVFDGARAAMTTSVRLSGDARYLGWEVLCLGRTAAGERFRAGAVGMRTEIWRDDVRVWSERARLHGDDPLLDAAAGCAGHAVCATMLFAGATVAPELLERLRNIEAAAECRNGITQLPGVLVARCLAPYAEPALRYFTALWGVLRPDVSGRPAVAPRIWST